MRKGDLVTFGEPPDIGFRPLQGLIDCHAGYYSYPIFRGERATEVVSCSWYPVIHNDQKFIAECTHGKNKHFKIGDKHIQIDRDNIGEAINWYDIKWPATVE